MTKGILAHPFVPGKEIAEALEDFEKPPKTPEYNPQVYRGWNGKMGKSKYSLIIVFASMLLATPLAPSMALLEA